jgi:surfeit locus 1 family protein
VAPPPLLRPKWLVGHALALTVVVSFTQFGFWQLRRHEQRAERNTVAEARLAATPVPLDDALAAALAEVAAGAAPRDAFHARRVAVSGRFEPADEVLRRPVSRDGAPGYHVVTPLALADDPQGRRLWVERGWVPQDLNAVPADQAPPPSGAVELTGWLRAPDVPPTGWVAALAPRDPADGRLSFVAYVDVARLAAQVDGPTVPAVLLLEAVAPPSPATLPLAPEPPVLGLGSHLGYAIQWFAFTAITLIGYPALLRRVRRESRAG